MKVFALLAVIVVAAVVGVVLAQPPERPKDQDVPAIQQDPGIQAMQPPGEHHKWLEQLVGTWTVESETIGEGTGTDTVRSLGGRWVVCDLKSEVPGMGPMNAVLTLGYNSETGKYQGTWVDSITDHLWVYEGTLDPTRKILTLEAEGPNMLDPTKGDMPYRDVIEFKSADHRTLTSSAFVDGEWVQFMTANYRKHQPGSDREQTKVESTVPEENQVEETTLKVEYLEIVTPAVDETCDALAKAHGVTFSEGVAELGNARTANLKNGGRIGVRAPLRETEAPVVRPYVLVDDIDAALQAAETAGGQVAMTPTQIPGLCTFAIYVLGGIDHGLWRN
jgi:predicted enzyme related to lactoylglutathione lyase